METYHELTPEQQNKAVQREVTNLLAAIVEGAIRFDNYGTDLQVKIDAAMEKADSMHTPWFAHEYIMDTCKDEIESIALANMEEALFPEPHEYCIVGIL